MSFSFLPSEAAVDAGAPYYYRAFGITIRSAIALPFLACPSQQVGAIVNREEERNGHVPALAPSRFEGSPDCIRIYSPSMGNFEVRGGRQITVPTERPGQIGLIAAVALGSLMPHLCHQRGLLPLHACTVSLKGKAIALAGPSGIGKSTLLNAFVQSGHWFLSDDLCAVDLSEAAKGGRVIALPCGPWLKLGPDAVHFASEGTRSSPETGPKAGRKSWIDLSSQFRAEPTPLAAILLISDTAVTEPIEFQRLEGVNALRAAGAVVSRWRQALVSQKKSVLFERATALFRTVSVYRLRRPKALEYLSDVVAAVERFAEEI